MYVPMYVVRTFVHREKCAIVVVGIDNVHIGVYPRAGTNRNTKYVWERQTKTRMIFVFFEIKLTTIFIKRVLEVKLVGKFIIHIRPRKLSVSPFYRATVPHFSSFVRNSHETSIFFLNGNFTLGRCRTLVVHLFTTRHEVLTQTHTRAHTHTEKMGRNGIRVTLNEQWP